jgi:DNA adenine methylase
MSAAKLVQPIKRHGGKGAENFKLAKWIISLMPARVENPGKPDTDDLGYVTYVEPYFGGGAVLLANNPEGISEVVSDLDGDLMNFWDVLRSRDHSPEFLRLASLTPVSDVEFERACNLLQNGHQNGQPLSPVERALAFFVRNRQSRQALAKDFLTPVLDRTRRGMNEHVSAWLSAVDGLPEVVARLREVKFYNRPAVEVIRLYDHARTLSYCDPPYLHETRTAKDAYGQFEMTEVDHRALLETLAGIKGRFLLSGYHSDLYDRFAREHGWHCSELPTNNKAGSGPKKREVIECVWTNYQPPEKKVGQPQTNVGQPQANVDTASGLWD